MSQDYDVFAELYENDKDDKAKFLETLKSRDEGVMGIMSSDEDELLPASFKSKERGRGKKSKPQPPLMMGIMSSDEDELLPANLKSKERGRGKKSKPQPPLTKGVMGIVSSDEDEFLPANLKSKERGRGKKSKHQPPLKKALGLQDTNGNKTKKLNAPFSENVQLPSTENVTSLLPTEPSVPTRRRSTRSARGSLSQNGTDSTITATTTATTPQRGRRGRRGRNNTSTALQGLAFGLPPGDSTIAETMNIFAAMMNGRVRQNVMRARREYYAEVAARASNVDYVDLVSSPMPRIEGVVTVDSDAEDSKSSNSVEVTGDEKPSTSLSNTLECSFDEDNPEVSVKIKWEGGNPEIFKLRKYQKFRTIFNEIAERERTPIDNLVFNIDNRIISASDTPASINYKIYEFISGRVLTDLFQVGTERKKRDVNIISLKIQSDLWPKKPLQVELYKTDKLKILYIKCAEELKMPTEDIILSFNGDHLGFNDTPEDFELENDEAVDLRLKKK